MSKPIIVIKLKPKDFRGILNLAEGVYENMHLNPNFISPQPTLAALQAATADLTDALAIWGDTGNRGSHAAYVNLTVKAGRLHKMLTQLGDWCMSSVDADIPYPEQSVILGSSGFALKNAKSPQGVLEAVQDFRRFFARTVKENQVKLRWKKPLNVAVNNNVKAYVVYRSATNEFSAAIIIGVAALTTYIDEPGAGTWFYWITPVNNKGQGVKSEVVTARIAEGL